MAKASAPTKKTTKASVKTVTKPVTEPVALKVTPKVVVPKRIKKISNKPFAFGTGRRKSAVAQVFLRKGNGQILVNDLAFDKYFTVLTSQQTCQESFNMFPMTTGMMADVKVCGGGFNAQAGAVRLGIARALLEFDEKLKPELRKQGFLTVDSRVKERKKYGQKAARAKFQFTKR